MALEDTEFREILKLLNRRGTVTYKEKYLKRRLKERLRSTNSVNYAEYLKYLKSEPNEIIMALKRLSINFTSFFRNIETFLYVQEILESYLLENYKAMGKKSFRIWSSGSAIGAETYTLAIIVDRINSNLNLSLDVKIIGTDFNEDLLTEAKTGIYDKSYLEKLPTTILVNYFELIDSEKYQVKSLIRKMVQFHFLDLRDADYLLRGIDLVVCRNVLIYFDPESQAAILKKIYFSTVPGGLLVIGGSEMVPTHLNPFWKIISPKHRVYIKFTKDSEMDWIKKGKLSIKAIFQNKIQLAIQKKRERKKISRLKMGKRKKGKKIFDYSRCFQCDLKFESHVKCEIHREIFHRILPRKREGKN